MFDKEVYQAETLAYYNAREAMMPALKKEHAGRYVVFKGGTLVGVFDTVDECLEDGLRLYPNGMFCVGCVEFDGLG